MWLVIWFHLVETFCRVHGISFAPLTFAKTYITGPLRLDLGQIGVLLFFYISGFIITHVAMREGQIEFGIKRILRIWPPMIAAVLAYAACLYFASALGKSIDSKTLPTTEDLWQTILLAPGIWTGYNPVLPVLWSLWLEIRFSTFTFLLLPTLKTRSLLACSLQLICCSLVIATFPVPGFARPAVLLTLLAPLFMGQVFYLRWANSISIKITFVFLAAWLIIGEWALQVDSTPYIADHPVSAWRCLTGLSVVLLIVSEAKLSMPPFVMRSADVSYSLYSSIFR
ncbi:MAG: acyltransferase [Acetobacteraceae bacterium]|nr:acyltransferase [Acetobacteraceae bacterium]